MYVDKTENSSKGNCIPDERVIEKLEDRNGRLVSQMQNLGFSDKHFEDLKLSIERDYPPKILGGFQGIGRNRFF